MTDERPWVLFKTQSIEEQIFPIPSSDLADDAAAEVGVSGMADGQLCHRVGQERLQHQ